jgi:2-alkenal reductase
MEQRERSSFSPFAVPLLALVVLIGLAAFGVLAASGTFDTDDTPRRSAYTEPSQDFTAQQLAQTNSTPAADGSDLTAVEVVQQVSPAVVTVINQQTGGGMLEEDEGPVRAGVGTGFIIDDDGHIVTNWHVVAGGEAFSVIFADGTEREANLIGVDPRNDLAVVQVDGDVPGTVTLGDSTALLPGQEVLAIGSPLGTFSNTVTEGIVSALGRNGDFASQPGCQSYTNLIQHDAAINPGNSGGPLFNMQGEVVGVNTLGIPTTDQGQPVQGLFFAVPSSIVADITTQIIENGEVTYPYLGIFLQPITRQAAAAADLPVDYGVYITDVEEGGPAAEAGLQADDIVLSLNGTDITEENSLTEILLPLNPGDEVSVTVLRDGEESEFTMTLGELPEDAFDNCALPGQQP